MSESRRRHRPGLTLLIAAFAAITFASPMGLGGQSLVDSLERVRAEVAARARAADLERRRVSGMGAVPAETLVVEGVGTRVIVQPAGMARDELAMISAGIRSARAGLERRFGPGAALLADTSTWYVIQPSEGWRFNPPLFITAGRGNNQTQWSFPRPIDAAGFERFALRRAGDRLGFRSLPIRDYAGTELSLATSDQRFANAARELRMSPAAPMRRCSMGSLADCRRILTAADSRTGLGIWYDSTDLAVAVAFAKVSFPFSDTLRWNRRRRCVEGNTAECASLAATIPISPPYSAIIRVTFVEHAMDVAPAGAIDTLLAATDGDPLELLARATGVSVDSLVAGWQRRSIAALDADQPSAAPTAFTTAIWSLLLLGVATRRRGTV